MRIGARELAIGGGLVLGAIVLRPRRRARRARGSSSPKRPSASQEENRIKLWAQLHAIPDRLMTEDQRRFLVYVAYGESRWDPLAHNDDATEVAASATAYDRVAARLAGCGRSRSAYVRGSGGRFGRLLPYFATDLSELLPCIDPASIWNGIDDIVSAVHLARVHQDEPSWDGTVGSVRAGWRTPGDLRPSAERLAKMRQTAVRAGLDAGFIDRQLDRFTTDLAGIRAALLEHAQVVS